jgi:exodeoxyribonuclease VII large subunit
MHALLGRLNALSPLAVLARGYAVARDDGGTTLGSTADFAPARDFQLLLRDGIVRATTLSIHPAPPRGDESE